MAKKRTLVNGYGKYHQRHEAGAAAAMRSGNEAMAKVHFAFAERPNPIGGFVRGIRVRGH